MSKDSETANKPPSRRERQHCWKIRDEYFACLESCGILDPETMNDKPDVREKGKSCLEKKKEYEEACMASWVEYFNKRRVLEERQRKYLQLAKEQSGKN
ncbi:hypothetical protein VKS41_004370 [Umbelopsis sp. WA50703]